MELTADSQTDWISADDLVSEKIQFYCEFYNKTTVRLWCSLDRNSPKQRFPSDVVFSKFVQNSLLCNTKHARLQFLPNSVSGITYAQKKKLIDGCSTYSIFCHTIVPTTMDSLALLQSSYLLSYALAFACVATNNDENEVLSRYVYDI